MSKLLWPAMSGAMARSTEVEVISNTLANANTNGFKKDAVTFKEYLAADQAPKDQPDPMPHPIRDKDLYPLEGKDQSFVVVEGTHTLFKSGALKTTDNPMDVALDGPGFLEVATPQGSRYFKGGSLKLDSGGRLVTTEGYPVLSQKIGEGPDPNALSRAISLSDRNGNLSITQSGEVFMGQEKVADLSVVDFKSPAFIKKIGGLYFENKDPVQNAPLTAQQSQVPTIVRQGVLETSNVNPVEEIANLIKANRMFEAEMKALKTANEMMAKEVNDLGRF